jgi:hypothetical protein
MLMLQALFDEFSQQVSANGMELTEVSSVSQLPYQAANVPAFAAAIGGTEGPAAAASSGASGGARCAS